MVRRGFSPCPMAGTACARMLMLTSHTHYHFATRRTDGHASWYVEPTQYLSFRVYGVPVLIIPKFIFFMQRLLSRRGLAWPTRRPLPPRPRRSTRPSCPPAKRTIHSIKSNPLYSLSWTLRCKSVLFHYILPFGQRQPRSSIVPSARSVGD